MAILKKGLGGDPVNILLQGLEVPDDGQFGSITKAVA